MNSVSKALLVGCSLTVLMVGQSADAQQRRPAAPLRPDQIIEMRKFDALGRTTLVKTPEYRTNGGTSRSKPGEWSQIKVDYTTFPEWIDQLDFEYHVLSLVEVRGEKKYSHLTSTVRYIDIPQGRSHYATIFLSPRAVKRFGMPVAVALMVRMDGNVVAEMNEASVPFPVEKWWTAKEVLESPVVTKRDGYLLNRNETPFKFIQIDDYEVIK